MVVHSVFLSLGIEYKGLNLGLKRKHSFKRRVWKVGVVPDIGVERKTKPWGGSGLLEYTKSSRLTKEYQVE